MAETCVPDSLERSLARSPLVMSVGSLWGGRVCVWWVLESSLVITEINQVQGRGFNIC